MGKQISCSHCRTSLELPAGNHPAVRCFVCRGINHVAPSQPSLRLSLQQPPAVLYGQKRAVVCGVSYRGTRQELKGCVNDAKFMKFLLINRFKFPESSIIMLTEDETDPYKIPTKHNIKTALAWLIRGCQPGDSLVFHYSGHGSQQRDLDGDEVDGFDETLLPLDFKTQGPIVDDEINATIVAPLPRGAKLHAIIDACHSGTVLDLPYLCRMDRTGQYIWEDHRRGIWKGTSGGEAISFSGCDDHQTSSDTTALSRITTTGAMTYAFIQAIERGYGQTYGNLLNAMRDIIRNTDASGKRLITSLLTKLTGRLRQEPQLTAVQTFDVYRKPFLL